MFASSHFTLLTSGVSPVNSAVLGEPTPTGTTTTHFTTTTLTSILGSAPATATTLPATTTTTTVTLPTFTSSTSTTISAPVTMSTLFTRGVGVANGSGGGGGSGRGVFADWTPGIDINLETMMSNTKLTQSSPQAAFVNSAFATSGINATTAAGTATITTTTTIAAATGAPTDGVATATRNPTWSLGAAEFIDYPTACSRLRKELETILSAEELVKSEFAYQHQFKNDANNTVFSTANVLATIPTKLWELYQPPDISFPFFALHPLKLLLDPQHALRVLGLGTYATVRNKIPSLNWSDATEKAIRSAAESYANRNSPESSPNSAGELKSASGVFNEQDVAKWEADKSAIKQALESAQLEMANSREQQQSMHGQLQQQVLALGEQMRKLEQENLTLRNQNASLRHQQHRHQRNPTHHHQNQHAYQQPPLALGAAGVYGAALPPPGYYPAMTAAPLMAAPPLVAAAPPFAPPPWQPVTPTPPSSSTPTSGASPTTSTTTPTTTATTATSAAETAPVTAPTTAVPSPPPVAVSGPTPLYAGAAPFYPPSYAPPMIWPGGAAGVPPPPYDPTVHVGSPPPPFAAPHPYFGGYGPHPAAGYFPAHPGYPMGAPLPVAGDPSLMPALSALPPMVTTVSPPTTSAVVVPGVGITTPAPAALGGPPASAPVGLIAGSGVGGAVASPSAGATGDMGATILKGSTPQQLRSNEIELTSMVVNYLESDAVNPYRASVPVERIQNVVRSKHPDLYTDVVGGRHNSWRRYVERHQDLFHLFCVDNGNWRMRLHRHQNWEEGDRVEHLVRVATEDHFANCLRGYLVESQGACHVDDFMTAYPTLAQNLISPVLPQCVLALGAAAPKNFPLPARGDLVRFVRRHDQTFTYNDTQRIISLKPPSDPNSPATTAATLVATSVSVPPQMPSESFTASASSLQSEPTTSQTTEQETKIEAETGKTEETV